VIPKVAVIRGSPIDGNEAGVVVVIAEIVFLVGEDAIALLNNDVTLIFWWNHNVINNGVEG